jgi:hypothetical protein
LQVFLRNSVAVTLDFRKLRRRMAQVLATAPLEPWRTAFPLAKFTFYYGFGKISRTSCFSENQDGKIVLLLEALYDCATLREHDL